MPSGVQFSFFGSFEVGTDAYPLSLIPFQEIVGQGRGRRLPGKPVARVRVREIAEAHRVMEAGEAAGKLVVAGA